MAGWNTTLYDVLACGSSVYRAQWPVDVRVEPEFGKPGEFDYLCEESGSTFRLWYVTADDVRTLWEPTRDDEYASDWM